MNDLQPLKDAVVGAADRYVTSLQGEQRCEAAEIVPILVFAVEEYRKARSQTAEQKVREEIGIWAQHGDDDDPTRMVARAALAALDGNYEQALKILEGEG